MKKSFFIIFFILGFFNLTTAQIKELSCIISREDYKNFYVTSRGKDSIFVSKDSLGDRFIAAKMRYKIIDGKGGKKDLKGDRERNKRYLVSSNGDSLAVIKNDNDIIQVNDSIINREQKEIIDILGVNNININIVLKHIQLLKIRYGLERIL